LLAIKDFKRIWITGAAGSVGKALLKRLLDEWPDSGVKVLAIDRDEYGLYLLQQELRDKRLSFGFFDLGHKTDLHRLFLEPKPDLIIHAAAFKQVPFLEDYPIQAYKNNVWASVKLYDLAIEHRVEHFVFISSDKAVEASSNLGYSKRILERYLRILMSGDEVPLTQILRFGNIMPSRGAILESFEHQWRTLGRLQVTDAAANRYFIDKTKCAELTWATIEQEARGLFQFEMGEPRNILDLAKGFLMEKGASPEDKKNIEFIGLRAGEKLEEKLFHKYEHQADTKIKGVYRIHSDEPKWNQLRLGLFRDQLQNIREAEVAAAFLRSFGK
jgi:FlaA1/EpsC-like NDP-sugar epimerase